jgi:SAM-dependent methyltransferase
VLDLACGGGDAALRAAEVVGPAGRVLGLDLSPGMIAVAREEASRRGLLNVDYRVIHSESALGVEPDSFDAGLCKHGLMWMPYPDSALRALFDAIRPGGRVSVSSWASLEDHPLFGGLRRMAEYHLGVVLPPEPAPPNPLTDRADLAYRLTSAGFAGVRVDTLPIPWDDADTPTALVQRAIEDDDTLRDAVVAADLRLQAELQSAAVAALIESQPGPPWIVSITMLVAFGTRP